MYKFNRSICLDKTISAQWHEINLFNVIVSEAYRAYSRFILELKEPVTNNIVRIDSRDIFSLYMGYGNTFAQLLVELGDLALPTTDLPWPETNRRFAYYSDSIQAGYKTEPANAGYRFDPNYPDDLIRDIRLTRPNFSTDMETVYKHCLFSVNGFYHLSDTDKESITIYDGNDNRKRFNDNHVGILSFLDIGELEFIPLSTIDVFLLGSKRIQIHTELDLTGRSVFLVLGGYLLFQRPNCFWEVNSNTFNLNFTHIPLLERVQESKNAVNLDNLISKVSDDNGDISPDLLFSNENLIDYVKHKNSFMVVVKSTTLQYRLLQLRSYKTPGIYSTPMEPVYPLVCGAGRVSEYWKAQEPDKWNLFSSTPFKYNRTYRYDHEKHKSVLNEKNYTNKQWDLSSGVLLEIST